MCVGFSLYSLWDLRTSFALLISHRCSVTSFAVQIVQELSVLVKKSHVQKNFFGDWCQLLHRT